MDLRVRIREKNNQLLYLQLSPKEYDFPGFLLYDKFKIYFIQFTVLTF